jgi:hypothetical protein
MKVREQPFGKAYLKQPNVTRRKRRRKQVVAGGLSLTRVHVCCLHCASGQDQSRASRKGSEEEGRGEGRRRGGSGPHQRHER